ncbi:MAG: hypothetical protein NZ521_03615 [Flammeovirgaceae bacterium]|nr:hypothetical protein [Flammeovirgaceae bacterium]MDW8287254.1 hypothetical protein [Flammeovirgaceae bacterium]
MKKIFLLCILSISLLACHQENKKPIREEDLYIVEEDPEFEPWKDSLAKFFNSLEISLLRQYKKNAETLATPEEFYQFFRNSATLKASIRKSLKSYLEKHPQAKAYEIKWFNQLFKGLEIQAPRPDVFLVCYNYPDLMNIAKRTHGSVDDEFILFMEICHPLHSDNYSWIRVIHDTLYCSTLGDGKHLKALLQIEKALDTGKLFGKEIQKTRVTIMKDLLFERHYCLSEKQVIKEIKDIIRKVKLKPTEIELLNTRIKQLADPNEHQAEFNLSKL